MIKILYRLLAGTIVAVYVAFVISTITQWNHVDPRDHRPTLVFTILIGGVIMYGAHYMFNMSREISDREKREKRNKL